MRGGTHVLRVRRACLAWIILRQQEETLRLVFGPNQQGVTHFARPILFAVLSLEVLSAAMAMVPITNPVPAARVAVYPPSDPDWACEAQLCVPAAGRSALLVPERSGARALVVAGPGIQMAYGISNE